MTPPDDVSTRLAEIRERVEAATEGPWKYEPPGKVLGSGPRGGKYTRRIFSGDETSFVHIGDGDAEFIAESRSDVPYLLSLVEKREDKMQEAIDHLEHVLPVNARRIGQCDFHVTAALEALRDAAQEGAE